MIRVAPGQDPSGSLTRRRRFSAMRFRGAKLEVVTADLSPPQSCRVTRPCSSRRGTRSRAFSGDGLHRSGWWHAADHGGACGARDPDGHGRAGSPDNDTHSPNERCCSDVPARRRGRARDLPRESAPWAGRRSDPRRRPGTAPSRRRPDRGRTPGRSRRRGHRALDERNGISVGGDRIATVESSTSNAMCVIGPVRDAAQDPVRPGATRRHPPRTSRCISILPDAGHAPSKTKLAGRGTSSNPSASRAAAAASPQIGDDQPDSADVAESRPPTVTSPSPRRRTPCR